MMSSISPCRLPRIYTLHDILKLYANNSVLATFKQFCALYFTIAIDIMETNDYHMAKDCFIRRISVASNAIQTIDNEVIISLSIVLIAFDATKIRRIKRA
jgi:hypothetical protein